MRPGKSYWKHINELNNQFQFIPSLTIMGRDNTHAEKFMIGYFGIIRPPYILILLAFATHLCIKFFPFLKL